MISVGRWLLLSGYENYTRQLHARDMLIALDSLYIPFCNRATHSTGGIIAARVLLAQPSRLGKVSALDPVTPLSIAFGPEQFRAFGQ